MSAREDLLVLPGEGQESDTHLATKIHASKLGDDFSVMEGVMEPWSLLTPHSHEHEDQVVIVLNGELVFEIGGDGGERFTAPAGSYVRKPRNSQHTFWNASDEAVRYIELSGGPGFQKFIDSTSELGSVQASRESQGELGMTWYYERIPKLMIDNRLRCISGVDLSWDKIKELGSPEDIIKRVRAAHSESTA